jgi:ATP-dependent DNA helicase RecQ
MIEAFLAWETPAMPSSSSSSAGWSLKDLQSVIARHWGFNSLRPLQDQAMRAVLEGRDSLVVLPTGGGKSLCYQAPAVVHGGTTVVISPLISLMKDQVDGLRACGVSAAQLDSSLSSSERSSIESALRRGKVNLLFVSPEKLVQSDLYRTLADLGVRTFAIDEAHCISHWGHDFRPEYRQLNLLRQHLPDAAIHAYTATATAQVRQDIITQLELRNPEVLVGNFDRPNLTYRVWPRHDVLKQVTDVLERHPGEAGIIYCMRRRDVDDLAAKLLHKGINARPYHAGLTPEERHATQEEFAAERCDVVVATIAFGMGIDRSNVRFVLHVAMPKSLEHYQQETGRAGRDGLEAECVLLYSGGDVASMSAMIKKSAEEAEDRSFLPGVLKHLEDMDRFARGAVCRHKALVEYFGQVYTPPVLPDHNAEPHVGRIANPSYLEHRSLCNACDLCLGDSEEVPDAIVVAQKILSCVARVKECFGVGHVLAILRGKNTDNVRRRKHDKLTTFGLLGEHSDNDVRDWIYQLIGQEALAQVGDEYPLLKLTPASWEIMRGQRSVRLVRLVRRKKGEKPQRSLLDVESMHGVDEELLDALVCLRKTLAAQRQVTPYIIFNDATLRELARTRPTTPEKMRLVYGVGEAKLRDFGPQFLQVINEHAEKRGLARDVQAASAPRKPEPPPTPSKLTPRQQSLYALFRQKSPIDEVMQQTGLARSTVMEHLEGFIRLERPDSIRTWVDVTTYQRVAETARQVGTDRLKPIFIALGEKIQYDLIRLVVAHLQGQKEEAS